jgi:hypothetical protein
MSYVSVHELIVHLNDFTISDEYAEAVYLVRISAYYEPNRTQPNFLPVHVPVKDTVANYDYQRVFSKPYKQAGPCTHTKIDDRWLVFGPIQMERRWGRDRCKINELCVFRIELPCYPSDWIEPLTIEFELLMKVDVVSLSNKDSGSTAEARNVRGLRPHRHDEAADQQAARQ